MASKKTDQLDRQIDENLRRVYMNAASEPVPDRFAKLLEQLRQREADTNSPKGQS
ncbi:NepR family anti-sigma factor [Yoonia sp.]|uniref:NepR family anti-sigma factor n=1 Tax=Yoonia sp. TaxID=2212373 RepID=UPI00391DB387